MHKLQDMAKIFCIAAHSAVSQKRKYTGDSYHVHPFSVAQIVSTVTDDEEMIAAAYLHDVIEDTGVTIDIVSDLFGAEVARLVDGLTDKSKPEDGNRKKRKEIDCYNLSVQCDKVKTIKLADLIDNTSSIVAFDPDFAKVYMVEKKNLLEALTGGDRKLMRKAKKITHDYFKEN